MQQVRWFVRVLDEWNVQNVEKKPFRVIQRSDEPVEAGFSLRIILFVLTVT